MKSILEMTNKEACDFLMKPESYCNFDLPTYFDFEILLKNTSKTIGNTDLKDCLSTTDGKKKICPDDEENINYTLLNNKDGKYAWRPLQIINPVLYWITVRDLTTHDNWALLKKRFKEFNCNNIKCISIPSESEEKTKSDKANTVLNWWKNIEQKSIALALDYHYMLISDVTNCYGSIYTHSISWAIHTKEIAKKKENRNRSTLLGNHLDKLIRSMQNGQTNGIPQGSVLMDLIAEIVLGYADIQLKETLNKHEIHNYEILRYRDDYRIFSNNPYEISIIAKLLSEVLSDLGLKINTSKTLVSSDIIKDAIKPDKLYYIENTPIYIGKEKTSVFDNLQKELLFIYSIANKFPNSGSILILLNEFYMRIPKKDKCLIGNIEVLLSIATNIALKNPNSYSVTAAIISKLIEYEKDIEVKRGLLIKIHKKFDILPNTGYLQIWMQHITLPLKTEIEYNEKLCIIVRGGGSELWNNTWLLPEFLKQIDFKNIINKTKIEKMKSTIDHSEFSIFDSGS